jgi:carboxyl-terminal processing protease
VPEGPIVELRGKEFEQMLVNSGDTESVPVAVLVNKGSASASEILAGAIRDRGVGILIGEPTFGKACVQSMIPLGDDVGGLRLTVAEYYTPSGESLAVKGLEPGVRVTAKDVQVPAKIAWARPIEPGTVGLDVLAVQQALAFLQIDPGELDGVFGPKTADAVGVFCEEHDIEFSGIVTGETAGKLNLAVTESAGHQPDIVFEKAKELLARKLQKGYWQ